MRSRIMSLIPLLTTLAVLVLGPLLTQPARAQGSAVETVILNVEGMWAEGCADYISKSLLGHLEGVGEVVVDHEAGLVTVDFDPALTSAERIVARIEDCPFFDVTGSDTHRLDEELVRSHQRACCGSRCRGSDA